MIRLELEAGVKMQLVEDDEDEHDCLEATDKLIAQGINAGDINKLQDAGIYTMMQTKKIIYARAYTYEHHYNLLLGLAARMSDEPFRLLIIDSSALFRVDFCGRVELAERQRQSVVKITTGSQTLDELLGGDIETSSITEAFREFRRSYIQPAILPPIFTARSGESQAAHKHCVSKQMPRSMQGGNGSLSMHGGNEKVAFSDTEGTFRPDRIVTIAKRFCLDSGAVLDNIIYGCAYIYEHQNYLLLGLAAKMFAEPFMLGISDSAIALFRVDFSRGGELSTCDQSLAPMLSRIIKIAEEFNVNVCMHDEVIAQGINAWDIKKLQDAGIYTCNGLVMQASKRQSVVKIITGNQTLDELLGGGIETSSITEAFREFRWSDIQLAILPPIFTARSGGNQVVHTHCVSTQMPCCMQQRLAQMLSRIIKIPEGFNSNVCMEEEVDETEAVENVLIQAAIALSDDKQRDDLFDLEFAMKKLRWITTRLSRRMELRGRRKLAIRSYLHQLEKVRLSGRMASFPLVRLREVGIKVRIQVPIFIRHVREYSVIFRPSTMSWHVIHLRLPHSSASLSHSIQPNILFTEEDPNHKSFLGINVLDPEWIQVGDETPYSLSPEVVGVVGRWLIMVPGTEGGMAYDRYNLALAPKIIPQVPIDFLTMKVQIFPVGHYLFMMTNTNEAMFTALSTESWQWVTPFPLKPQSLRFNMVGVYTNKLIIVGFSQTSESFPVWAVEMVNGLPSEAEENFSLLKSIPLPDIADAVWKWDQSMRMCQEYIFFSCFNRNVINVIYYNLKTGATETSMVESVGVVKPWHATCISAAVGSFYV